MESVDATNEGRVGGDRVKFVVDQPGFALDIVAVRPFFTNRSFCGG